MDDKQINSVIEMAIKICRDEPELSYSEAIEKAKEMMKDEEKGLR